MAEKWKSPNLLTKITGAYSSEEYDKIKQTGFLRSVSLSPNGMKTVPQWLAATVYLSIFLHVSFVCPLTQSHSCFQMHLSKCSIAPLMCVSLSESLVPDGWLRDQGCRGVERFFLLSAEFWSLWLTCCHSAFHCHGCSLCKYVLTVQSCGCRTRQGD